MTTVIGDRVMVEAHVTGIPDPNVADPAYRYYQLAIPGVVGGMATIGVRELDMGIVHTLSIDSIRRAIADPKAILPRIEGETVAAWGARAVVATIERGVI